MNDKIEIKPQVISPLKKICMTIGELPTSYLETMTYYEMLVWFTNYLRDTIIPVVNNNGEAVTELQNLFVELQTYVNDYFDNLDVQDEIDHKIDEMVADGSFLEILSEITNQTNTLLNYSIEYRNASEYINGITDETTPIKGYAQGITTTPNSIIIAYTCGGTKVKNNMVYLEEISKTTKETIKSAYLELFHANCLAYNSEDREIYVATHHRYEGETAVTQNDIIIVDYDTFAIKETVTIDIDDHIRSVMYDNNNHILALGSNKDVYIMSDWETVESHIVLSDTNTLPNDNPTETVKTNQMITLLDGKIYSLHLKPNGLTIYDMEGNVLKNYFNDNFDIPSVIEEYESIAVESDGTIYLATVQIAGTWGTNLLYDVALFKSNFITGGYRVYNDTIDLSARVTFYVDKNTTNYYQLGTSSKPFKYLEQAVLALQSLKNDITVNINLVGTNVTYGFIESKNNVTFNLNGNGNSIHVVKLQQQTCKLISCKILNTNQVNVAGANPSNIYLDSSNVTLQSCEISNTLDSAPTYGIVINQSNVNVIGTTINNYVNAFNLLAFSNLKIDTITVTNCTYYWKTNNNTNYISYRSVANLNRVNPASDIMPVVDLAQTITFTYNSDTNTVTFSNTKIDSGTTPSRNYLFNYTIGIDGRDYKLTDVMNNTLPRFSHSLIHPDKTFVFDVQVVWTHTNGTGVWTGTLSIIREKVADGTMMDYTTGCTLTVNSINMLL